MTKGSKKGRMAVFVAIGFLSGCAQTPNRSSLKQPSLPERSGIQRIIVQPDAVPPQSKFETFAVGTEAGWKKGLANPLPMMGSGLVGPETLLLAPLLILMSGAYGASKALPLDQAQAIEELAKGLLTSIDIERRLAELVVEASRDSGYILTLAPLAGADNSPTPEANRASDAVLETDVLEFGFSGQGKDPSIAMYLTAKARLLRVSNGTPLGESAFRYQSQVMKLNEWLDQDGKLLSTEFEAALRQLSKDIVEQRLMRYPYGTREGVNVSETSPAYWPELHLLHYPDAINPGATYERIIVGTEAIAPGKSIWPPPSFSWVPPTIDTLQPDLSWNAFQSPMNLVEPDRSLERSSIIGYEICVWKPPKRGWLLAPRGCVYERKWLSGTSHVVEETLAPDERYLWSVRTRFRADGSTYLTAWGIPLVFDTPSPRAASRR